MNNNLLFDFSGHNNDLLVLKQLKGAFQSDNALALQPSAAALLEGLELKHYPVYITLHL